MAINIILLIFSGAFGAVISPFVMRMVSHFVTQPTPRVVFFVNILSCFIVGFASIFHYSQSLNPHTRLMLVIGLCAGFIVCSTFSHGNATLWKGGAPTATLLYLLGSIVLGSLAVLMGQLTATFFNKL
ncbi:MAG: fluoride efflux transporter FluC [Prevotella nigrescens]|jgi:CrcB-like protein|uniref:Fluoride-specific ion channel n=1 Tax=Prevotella nigrescens TaxID=28133 RepID=A0A9D5WU50_9BACT|nr:CrcB family protein [Prevotella nigrescens]ELX66364.1 protein CrcB [Prevotella nigrescens F0103]MBF1444806.1 CrcB family protein [Prevotella nigrescens]MBF1446323.1 CrcB family protein [Prevotella nigrescens]MBF1453328.1 CrcB family protein [Prevotella nigrescens]OWP29003.1 camphor resistance protein CrcB2 [Prevotella nigrescens]